MSPASQRTLGVLVLALGILLTAAGIAALILAQNLSEIGFASLEDAAPVPIAGIVLGLGAIALGIVGIRRARSR